ncbi:MAG TPA: hypothetical protein DEP48_00185 [Persephonella sp.]|uniref:Uncharacterized protein n=1 Tax=Persephonella marina (strain DSM 14350 / EX-H1) TaxID=123214 RepID=C0QQQ8_PERMH|nr:MULTISPECIES: hypothetical protein [Persephonella]ACO03678.1 hypothetical protein PERMA_1231 [Persephonella marina EX-H1]HCB68755.1 hypothetical protein [Persephonella sp.]
MRELIEEFSSGKGIKAILEYDREKDIYVMTVYKGDEKIVFSGKMDEIQKQAERYFVKSLKSLKNKIEIALLEDLYNR